MAAGAEESAASSEELTAQAQEMRVIVSDLARMVRGSRKEKAGPADEGPMVNDQRLLSAA